MRKAQALVLTGCLALVMASGGCGTPASRFADPKDGEEADYVFAEQETYTNALELEGQWGQTPYSGEGQYGIGDPFVMRYDGKYYMYPSSTVESGGETGVKVFESEDLVNWTYKGLCATGKATENAYAPEVVYYDGTFYMCESQNGTGHYILKSDSPIGPFEVITDNFGRNIDGSFWVSDEGKLLFLYAGSNVVQIAEMDTETMLPGLETSLTATLNGWTEGPSLFRRNNILYLTYAGNGVTKDGYRVGYSYQKGNDPSGMYVMPENNLVLIKTGPDNFRGLGHSSNVIGPDLDSWYTAYHNLLSTAGPQRRLMIDQLCTNGGILSANGPTYSAVAVPKRPDFEQRLTEATDQFSSVTLNGKAALVSKTPSENVFTAEYNFKSTEDSASVDCVFGYRDESNYYSVRWDAAAKTLSLVKASGGAEKVLASTGLGASASAALHTIRVENGYKQAAVYLDSMQKLTVSDSDIPAGGIGYASASTVDYSYTAFSNDAFGSSDFDTIKNLPSSFAAVHYLKGEQRGFSIKDAAVKAEGVRQGEKENTQYNESDGSSSLILNTPGDWVKYAVNATETSYYGLTAYVTPETAGSQFQVIVDSRDIYTFTVPDAGEVAGGYVNLLLGQFPLEQGNHTLKVRLVNGQMSVRQWELLLTNPTDVVYENAMNEINEKGWAYSGNWKIVDGAHTAVGDTAYAFAGTEKLTNFSMEASVALEDEDSIYDGGFLLRCKNESVTTDGADCLQGYYLSIRSDQVSLNKNNYDTQALDLVNVSFEKGEYHRIRAELINNRIRIFIDDMETPVIVYYDESAFLSGELALCTNKAGISFKDVVVKTYATPT